MAALFAGSAAAAPAETPAQFVARLFKSDQGPRFVDPAFEKLIDDNSTLAGKHGDADLDYQPICQCQDSGGHYGYLSGKPGADGLFDAKVSGHDSRPPWTLVLKPEAGGWRVYDVIDQTGSVRALLVRHNDCMRKFTADAKLVACFGQH